MVDNLIRFVEKTKLTSKSLMCNELFIYPVLPLDFAILCCICIFRNLECHFCGKSLLCFFFVDILFYIIISSYKQQWTTYELFFIYLFTDIKLLRINYTKTKIYTFSYKQIKLKVKRCISIVSLHKQRVFRQNYRRKRAMLKKSRHIVWTVSMSSFYQKVNILGWLFKSQDRKHWRCSTWFCSPIELYSFLNKI